MRALCCTTPKCRMSCMRHQCQFPDWRLVVSRYPVVHQTVEWFSEAYFFSKAAVFELLPGAGSWSTSSLASWKQFDVFHRPHTSGIPAHFFAIDSRVMVARSCSGSTRHGRCGCFSRALPARKNLLKDPTQSTRTVTNRE